MLPRIFVEGQGETGMMLRIGGDDGRHFARVLRVRPGERLVVAMDDGPWLGEIAAVEQADVVVSLHGRHLASEPAAQFVLVQGMAKGDKMESILQKCTEIGAISFVVYQAERSVARIDGKVEAKLERWRKIIREAAMQAQRDCVPDLTYVKSLSDLARLLQGKGVTQTLLLDEMEQAQGLRSALQMVATDGARALLVGPEGGWADAERDAFMRLPGACAVTLGRRILRTETAGMAALAAALMHFGDMGG
ncbi:16S rRNA (uracil1498-N3)-methyltransferase [Alicyclobacillus sacchari]|uniref:Ribosomal RNA small subunit methyltransferase E n=1 Tax=Alicyclobacillus sacchari TaxID=392010 RepID=A0A4R8LP09_9BACL|nr:RsmE family RNA methyltransferase [Alicyclobacillus sacchari]TDY48017.1 16S rRNA (uracil1498-N3)-methyltransferase [Alicyclobacillus sacchari]GMA56150.1 ribosomal RNA small subunit methyltransferase E [Alicyclobacillus sacchari]